MGSDSWDLTSSISNLKELRVQHAGEPWRILFVFDPKRRAIILVGGNKAGQKRWYEEHIQIAEARYAEHIQRIELEEKRQREHTKKRSKR